MNTLKILEDADREYAEAAEWYEKQKEGLGERFIDVIQRRLRIIQQYPERYPRKKGDFREAVVKIFPYVVVYTFYKRKKMVVINSIFHTRRNPRMKYRRK